MALVCEPHVLHDLEFAIDYYVSSHCQQNIYEEPLIECGPLTGLRAIVWFIRFN